MRPWRELTLGDVLTRARRTVQVEDGVEYPAVSVTKDGQGLGAKEPFVGGVSKYKTLNRVEANDVVLRTITAFESPVGVAGPEHDGTHVSGVFITYEVGADAMPAYLRLFFQTPALWRQMRLRATGTVLRRKTISSDSFLDIPLSLPPLDVQRRIVDLVGALDDNIAALEAETAATTEALRAASTDLAPGDETAVAELLTRQVGGVWGGTPGSSDLDVHAYRTTEFTDLGYLSGPAEAVRSITQKQFSTRSLEPGDILMEGSGGTPNRPVGRVVRVEGDDCLSPSIGTNFLKILRVDSAKADPNFVFWLLWGWHAAGIPAQYQTASTNIRNLQTVKYLGRTLSLPDRQTQGSIARALDAQLGLVRSLSSEARDLRELRASLLPALLSGEVEIPESYDTLLELQEAA